MCKSAKWILNKYDGKRYFVKCGHCDSCIQEKADARVRRIKEETKAGHFPVFVLLHYENDYIPYVKKEEFRHTPKQCNLKVYRGFGDDEKIIKGYRFHPSDFESLDLRDSFTESQLPSLCKMVNGIPTFDDRYMSVVHLPDMQKFIKRLKISMFRDGYQGYFSYYYSFEYGTRRKRAHLHALFFIDKEYYEKFRCLLNKCWPYADLLKCRRNDDGTYRDSIEVARNPAKYIASYINCRDILPPCLSAFKPVRPVSHFSNGFGTNFHEFSLHSLLDKVDRGTVRYPVTVVTKECSSVSFFKLPHYVVSRWFPKFLGYSSLDDNEIIGCCLRPSRLLENAKLRLRFDFSVIKSAVKHLERVALRVARLGEYWRWLFAYPKIWRLMASDAIMHSYDEESSFYSKLEHYDNLNDAFNKRKDSLAFNVFLDDIGYSNELVQKDPNDFGRNVRDHFDRLQNFKEKRKHHMVKQFYYNM